MISIFELNADRATRTMRVWLRAHQHSAGFSVHYNMTHCGVM